ncbi:MAG: hypothetical protein ACRDRP_01725 [Pseudonocardiaceae bacterium]
MNMIHRQGIQRRGRYVALCGAEVLPAAMEEPGRSPTIVSVPSSGGLLS